MFTIVLLNCILSAWYISTKFVIPSKLTSSLRVLVSLQIAAQLSQTKHWRRFDLSCDIYISQVATSGLCLLAAGR